MKKLTSLILLFKLGFVSYAVAQSPINGSNTILNEGFSSSISGTDIAPPEQAPQITNQNRLILKQNSDTSTYTYIRCFFYDDNSNLKWLWGTTSANQYAQVYGSWTKGGNYLYNQFYTRATHEDILQTCKNAFGHSSSEFNNKFINYGAANYQTSFHSEFWFQDGSQISSDKKPITRIVAFGDSLSDTHNMYNKTNWILPKSSAYMNGRFTNGFVWNEYVANYLNSNMSVFAEGGAQIIGNGLFDGYISLTLQEQLDSFNNTINFLPSSARNIDSTLFIVFIGGNDFLNKTAPPTKLAEGYLSIIEKLLQLGAKYIVVPVFFDISLAPEVAPENKLQISNDIKIFNEIVQNRINDLKMEHSDTKFLSPNFDTYMNEIKTKFSNVTDICNKSWYVKNPTGTICKKAGRNNYLFWDKVHPSARAHCYLGYYTNLYLADELGLPKPTYPNCDSDYIDKIN